MPDDKNTENQLMLPDDSKIAAMTQHIGILSQGMQFLQQVAAGEIAADAGEIQNAIAVMQESSGFIELFHAEIAPVLGGAKAMIETLRSQRDEALGELENLQENIQEEVYESIAWAEEEIFSDGFDSALNSYDTISNRVREVLIVDAEEIATRLRAEGKIDEAEQIEQIAKQAASTLKMTDELSDTHHLRFMKEDHAKWRAEIEAKAAAGTDNAMLSEFHNFDDDDEEEEDFEQELEDEA